MLTSPAIDQFTTESGPQLIWKEWLGKWFDGQEHAIGVAVIRFPKVTVAFDESAPDQPLQDLEKGTDSEIRVITLSRSETLDSVDSVLYGGKLVQDKVLVTFLISSKKAGEGQARYQARRISELLKALLTNPDTRFELNQKGIMTIRPMPASPIPSKDYQRRLLPCAAELHYGITFDSTVTPPNAGNVQFQRESVFVVGEYLVGLGQWPVAQQGIAATIVGFAPQAEAQVVELEVAGELTGKQLTLAVGAPLEEVSDTVSLIGVIIPANAEVRWKIVAGPDNGEQAAWKAGLAMNVVPVGS